MKIGNTAYYLGRDWYPGLSQDPPVDASETWSDDFTGQVSDSALRSRANWTAVSSSGATSGERDFIRCSNEQVEHNGGGDFTGIGKFIIVHDMGANSISGSKMKFKMTRPGSGTVYVVVNSSNEQNCLSVNFSSVYAVQTRINNTANTVASLTSLAPANNDIFEICLVDNRFELYKNYVRIIGPTTITAMANNANKGSYFGFGTASWGSSVHGIVDDLVISTQKNWVTVTNDSIFYPSWFTGGGTANTDFIGVDVDFTGTYGTFSGASTPTGMQIRIVNEDDRTQVFQDWTTVQNFSASAGSWSGTVWVNPTYNSGVAECRFYNDTSIVGRASTTIAVGFTMAFWGQSNSGVMTGFGSATSETDPYRSNKIYAYNRASEFTTPNPQWVRNNSGQAACAAVRQISDAFGGMCGGSCGMGLSARAITDLWPGTSSSSTDYYNGGLTNNWTYFKQNLTAARAIGKIMFLVWIQGEAEGEGTNLMDPSDYNSKLQNLITESRIQIANNAQIKVGIGMTGVSSSGATANQNSNWTSVRRQQRITAANSGTDVFMTHNSIGSLLSDTIHFGGPGAVNQARKIGLS